MASRILPLIALGTLLAPAAASAQSAPSAFLSLQPQSRVWVEGTSSVRSFSCKASKVDATVQTSTASAAAATLAGQKAVSTVQIRIPARSLDCENGTMNGHMYKALKADDHPSIAFRMSGYELAPKGAQSATLTLSGVLSLGGQERPITLVGEAKQGPGGTLHVVGTHPVKLSDHGLQAPSLMMGTMKVGDVVNVKFDLNLKD